MPGAARRSVDAIVVTAVVALVAALVPLPALAHGGLLSTTPVVVGVSPALPDEVEVEVVPTQVATMLRVSNPTDTVLEVAQRDGTPWLRISSAGVEVDAGVVDTYATTSPEGGGVPGDVVRGERAREWVLVSEETAWQWFEHRLHPEGLAAPRALAPGEQPADEAVEVLAWEVPLRYGEQDVVVEGRLELRVPTGRVGAALADGAQVPEGVQAQVLSAAIPGVLLTLAGAQEVVVLGIEDEPYLRFTPDGVEVATGSPTHRAVEAARGQPLPPTPEDAGWEPVAGSPTHAWLEIRGQAPLDLPESVRLSGRQQDLLSWEVPLLVDGQEASLAGVTTWEPFEGLDLGGGGLPGWVPVAAVAVAIALGALALRRRSTSAE